MYYDKHNILKLFFWNKCKYIGTMHTYAHLKNKNGVYFSEATGHMTC